MQNILERITSQVREEMESIWYTADLHHGHPKIVDYCNRPVTKENHDNWLINEVINKWVKKKDTLYILGDLSMAKKSEAEKFIDKLNGNKFFILGGHDKNIHNSTRFIQITQRKDFNYSRFGINIHIILDHYPIASWNRKIHGAWHLYGHVHGRFKNNGLSFDVGIDNSEIMELFGIGYRPINLYEVCQIMQQKYEVLKLHNKINEGKIME